MFIHHYTSAETLPLILRNRTLRFSRADQLDDASEVPFRTNNFGPQRYFVSSWSQGFGGEAGLWYRYGDHDRGVRLSLHHMPFDWTRLTVNFSREVLDGHRQSKKVGVRMWDIAVPFREPTLFGNGYIVTPTWTDLPNTFGAPVVYVDDPATEAAKAILVSDEQLTINGDSSLLARIKGKGWADQDEYRFVLSAIKGPGLDYATDPSRYKEAVMDLMESGLGKGYHDLQPEVSAIYVPLGVQAFAGMTVTLGPKISQEDRAMVTALMKELAPTATVAESALIMR